MSGCIYNIIRNIPTFFFRSMLSWEMSGPKQGPLTLHVTRKSPPRCRSTLIKFRYHNRNEVWQITVHNKDCAVIFWPNWHVKQRKLEANTLSFNEFVQKVAWLYSVVLNFHKFTSQEHLVWLCDPADRWTLRVQTSVKSSVKTKNAFVSYVQQMYIWMYRPMLPLSKYGEHRLGSFCVIDGPTLSHI